MEIEGNNNNFWFRLESVNYWRNGIDLFCNESDYRIFYEKVNIENVNINYN